MSPTEPVWLDLKTLIRAHDLSIERHGGLSGVRDGAALESACARPQNKWLYGETDIMLLAAAYGFGLARNHAFNDGNKRAAFIATLTFLTRNGFSVNIAAADGIATFLALAAGDLSEEQLADWLRSRATPA